MTQPANITVKFWGTRGSYPQSSSEINFFGGKTSCISIDCGETLIVMDAGSGLIDLGNYLLHSSYKDIHILLLHTHHDHILGIPFFQPLWQQHSKINFYCATAQDYGGIEAVLRTTFSPPYFPLAWTDFKAERMYIDFKYEEQLTLTPEINVETIALNHPGGGSGFRINYNNKSIIYLCDTDKSDFKNFCHHADLLIYDATFTPEEYLIHPEWGHSTWQEGVTLARSANVKQLAFFHHAPDHDDRFLKNQERKAQNEFADCCFAYQGQIIVV